MEPGRDLDSYGRMLMLGDLDAVKNDFDLRVHTKALAQGLELAAAKELVVHDLFALKWGPTGVPIYNLLGLSTMIVPDLRPEHLAVAEWFIKTVKLPVNGLDYSGSTALSHSFSTKPCLDLEYAQMLYDAGGDVNNRSRYGAIVAHEIVQIYDVTDPQVVAKAASALEWFLAHGGNVDIQDSDGVSPRKMLELLRRKLPSISKLLKLVEKEDERRKLIQDRCCSTCGREAGETLKLLNCGKCKEAKYCDPQVRSCQRLQWPVHKQTCKAAK